MPANDLASTKSKRPDESAIAIATLLADAAAYGAQAGRWQKVEHFARQLLRLVVEELRYEKTKSVAGKTGDRASMR